MITAFAIKYSTIKSSMTFIKIIALIARIVKLVTCLHFLMWVKRKVKSWTHVSSLSRDSLYSTCANKQTKSSRKIVIKLNFAYTSPYLPVYWWYALQKKEDRQLKWLLKSMMWIRWHPATTFSIFSFLWNRHRTSIYITIEKCWMMAQKSQGVTCL